MDKEVERRLANARRAAGEHGLDAVLVVGSEYTGFDGAVRYFSGFTIVHRYAYVLLPLEGSPTLVFPSEARYVGEHGAAWVSEQVFAEHPGNWLADRLRGLKVGVHGLDYVMPVRDYAALAAAAELVPFDVELDLARAVKSVVELESVRSSVRINEDGFRIVLEAYAAGKSEASILAPAEQFFAEQGCGRHTMNMVLGGEPGPSAVEFRIASVHHRVRSADLFLPSLEIAGPGGHWTEVSRPICGDAPPAEARSMLEAYLGYFEATERTLRDGATAHDVHRAIAAGFTRSGYQLGHVTGHSIGMTMIEHPRIGEGEGTVVRENMVLSMHPHVMGADGRSCFFMQDTWLVGRERGIRLSTLPTQIFDRRDG